MNYESVSQMALYRLERIGSMAFSTFTTIKNTYLCAKHLVANNVEGCFIECGVANGSQVGAMCLALEDSHQTRAVHLFDSFEGIPYAGPNDADQPGIGPFVMDQNKPLRERLVSSGVSGSSQDAVEKRLYLWGFSKNLHYHKGWFQDTLPAQVPEEPIALLRLDGDLYESTECCLTHLADRVAKGGIIIIDDYALPGCRKAVDEYLAAHSLNPTIESVPESTVKWWFVL